MSACRPDRRHLLKIHLSSIEDFGKLIIPAIYSLEDARGHLPQQDVTWRATAPKMESPADYIRE
jgi:hypothetical protein